MLIRSQDKTMLINLENIVNINIAGERIGVVYFQGECADTIAEYSTKEKAIKVLDMIESEYLKANKGTAVGHYGFVENRVFKMPQDDEVEV